MLRFQKQHIDRKNIRGYILYNSIFIDRKIVWRELW